MKKLQILVTMLLMFTTKLFSQEYIPYCLQEDNIFIHSKADMVPLNGWVVFNDSINIPNGGMINCHKNELGFSNSDSLALKSTIVDNFPFTNINNKYKHLKYQQYFNGIRVEYAEFMEHSSDPKGRKRFSQGEIVLSPVPTSSNLTIHVESTTYNPATTWNIKVLNYYGIAQFSNNSWTTLPTSINVSNLYAGTYMLHLISNRETVVIPFQKN